jgi:hypothetical protein
MDLIRMIVTAFIYGLFGTVGWAIAIIILHALKIA